MIFFIYGIPGVLLAGIVLMLREPPRRQGPSALAAATTIPLRGVAAYLWRHRLAYGGIIIGFALMILVGNGTSSWIPTFFMRKFHWTAQEVGSRYGTLVILCGASGTVIGGLLATYLRRIGLATGNLIASLAGFVVLVPLTVAFPLMADGWTSLYLIGAMNFFAGFPFGGGLATLQEITPNAMRAQVAALYALFVNLLGQGVGPLLIGNMTDFLFHDPGHLPQALSITAAIFSPLALVFLLMGMAGFRRLTAAEQ
jgi:MFS family permease